MYVSEKKHQCQSGFLRATKTEPCLDLIERRKSRLIWLHSITTNHSMELLTQYNYVLWSDFVTARDLIVPNIILRG